MAREYHEITQSTKLFASPKFANAKVKLDKNEIDILLVLMSEIQEGDGRTLLFKFNFSDFQQKLGYQIHPRQLKATAKSMMNKVIEYDDGDNWRLWHIFDFVEYKDGTLTLNVSAYMYPLLVELKPYIPADIRQLLPMKNQYSKRIYLLLKERLKHGSRIFEIEELNSMFKLPKSYGDYGRLKARVLDPSVAEINMFTDLEVGYEEYKKQRKKVTSIKFTIKKNQADLSQFIGYIRELYVNQPLTYYNDRLLKCATTGLLYFSDDLHTLDTKTADKAWKHIHANRERLLCFQHNLLDFTKEENDF